MPGPHRWRPGESGNPIGRPRTGLAISEIIRASCDIQAQVMNLQRIALGQPMFRYRDANGKTCCGGDPPPEGSTDVREHWPSDSEALAASQALWNRMEPVSKKLDITHSRGLDAQSAYNLGSMSPEKLDAFIELTSELAEPGDDASDD